MSWASPVGMNFLFYFIFFVTGVLGLWCPLLGSFAEVLSNLHDQGITCFLLATAPDRRHQGFIVSANLSRPAAICFGVLLTILRALTDFGLLVIEFTGFQLFLGSFRS